jgi:hypothetical protein
MEALSINLWEQGFVPIRYPTKNLTAFWSSSDSEEKFKKNPVAGYTETSIVYKYNSHGYRTKEFDFNLTDSNILCFGCSHTEGIGVREEDTWPSKLQDKFPNHTVYNLGDAGASGDTVTRILLNSCSIFKPSKVFILWPEIARFETYSYKDISPGYPTINFHSIWDADKNNSWKFDEIQLKSNFDRNRAVILLLQEIFYHDLYSLSSFFIID